MKIYSLAVAAVLFALVAGCTRLTPPSAAPAPVVAPPVRHATFSSFDTAADTPKTIPPHMIKFQEMALPQLLEFYQELSGRTLIRSPQVPVTSKITVENTTALTRTEALQMLDNVLAAQQIAMVYLGTSYVKVVPAQSASSEAGLVMDGPWRQLPDSSSFVTYITKLKTLSAEDAVSILAPYAKLPNSLVAVKGSDVLVLRDYSANVRRMMDILERVEASGAKAKQ